MFKPKSFLALKKVEVASNAVHVWPINLEKMRETAKNGPLESDLVERIMFLLILMMDILYNKYKLVSNNNGIKNKTMEKPSYYKLVKIKQNSLEILYFIIIRNLNTLLLIKI